MKIFISAIVTILCIQAYSKGIIINCEMPQFEAHHPKIVTTINFDSIKSKLTINSTEKIFGLKGSNKITKDSIKFGTNTNNAQVIKNIEVENIFCNTKGINEKVLFCKSIENKTSFAAIEFFGNSTIGSNKTELILEQLIKVYPTKNDKALKDKLSFYTFTVYSSDNVIHDKYTLQIPADNCSYNNI